MMLTKGWLEALKANFLRLSVAVLYSGNVFESKKYLKPNIVAITSLIFNKARFDEEGDFR